MFVAKKHIARRTFLRGAGVTLALPLLESMVPALTPARLTAAAPVRRFVAIWHPHGASPGYWSPLQKGRNFEFSFITKPLEAFRDRTVLITGLDMPEAMATTEEPGGDQARGAVLLSGARPRRNAVSPFLGITVDQHIANKYGQDTILSSLQLGVEDTGNFGNCLWTGRYPVVDHGVGGSLAAMAAALEQMDKVGDANTRIISGHGAAAATKAEVREAREAWRAINQRREAHARQGRSADEAVAATPTREFDSRFGVANPPPFVR